MVDGYDFDEVRAVIAVEVTVAASEVIRKFNAAIENDSYGLLVPLRPVCGQLVALLDPLVRPKDQRPNEWQEVIYLLVGMGIDCLISGSKSSRGNPRASSQHSTPYRRSGHRSHACLRVAAKPSGGHHARPLYGRPSPLRRTRHCRNGLGLNPPPLGKASHYQSLSLPRNRVSSQPLPPLRAPQRHGSGATRLPFDRWCLLAPQTRCGRLPRGGWLRWAQSHLPRRGVSLR